MGDVVNFPTLSMTMIPVEELPPGTRYKCEGPDWIVRKTTDDGQTWMEIGRLDPPKHPKATHVKTSEEDNPDVR